MVKNALCTTQELIASFPSLGDAFYWFGAASWGELLDREAQIAKTRPTRPGRAAADTNASCAGDADAAAYLAFDVETDGGSPKQLAIQIAFAVFNKDHKELFRFDKLLKLPPGKKINYHSIKIHKISDNVLALRGVEPVPALNTFFEWVDKVQANDGKIVAHNAAFDASVVTNTAAQNGMPRELHVQECFCTMRSATPFCGLTNKAGRPKPPKNSELFEILHGHPTDARLHDALEDVLVTAASYQKGCEKRWW